MSWTDGHQSPCNPRQYTGISAQLFECVIAMNI